MGDAQSDVKHLLDTDSDGDTKVRCAKALVAEHKQNMLRLNSTRLCREIMCQVRNIVNIL
ncbi:hypothetical protein GCM10008111_14660 [Alishewanella tabrizica]|uniref:Uncharacterized protein n=1 Tax=Alishewanella tabrizica TaxID=671278 RepID=A0ABQ2WLE3_9ALTE|nr:hypothetical protein GCM10008111_14660 [Alishewanella tabrizica]